jgi:hypothetical protein
MYSWFMALPQGACVFRNTNRGCPSDFLVTICLLLPLHMILFSAWRNTPVGTWTRSKALHSCPVWRWAAFSCAGNFLISVRVTSWSPEQCKKSRTCSCQQQIALRSSALPTPEQDLLLAADCRSHCCYSNGYVRVGLGFSEDTRFLLTALYCTITRHVIWRHILRTGSAIWSRSLCK